jgi:hypothetical protein
MTTLIRRYEATCKGVNGNMFKVVTKAAGIDKAKANIRRHKWTVVSIKRVEDR